jgi:multisubunit Na+/H+ antiporter MnhB subunit
MRKKDLLFQEKIFDFVVYLFYFLLIISSVGLFYIDPSYLDTLKYYINTYICLFLLWRFNPLKKHFKFTNLDRKIAFSAGGIILTTTIIYEYFNYSKSYFLELTNKYTSKKERENFN